MTDAAEPSTHITSSPPLLAHVTRFLKNYVLRFFIITTLVTVSIGVVFLPLDFLESYLYPDNTQNLVPDTIILFLPAIFICLGLFLRLRHPNAKVERADAIMYAVIFAVLLLASAITIPACWGCCSNPAFDVVLWITSFPYAPSIILWTLSWGGSCDVQNGLRIYLASTILITLAFAAVASWILAQKTNHGRI